MTRLSFTGVLFHDLVVMALDLREGKAALSVTESVTGLTGAFTRGIENRWFDAVTVRNGVVDYSGFG